MKILLPFILLAIGFLPTTAAAHEHSRAATARIHRNDGNARLIFAITCSSSAWTVVGVSAVTGAAHSATAEVAIRRRSMTVQTLATVTYAVCLSSTSVAGDTCADGRAGYELGSAWGSVSIYDESLWYCRTRTGGSTAIKGVEFYDNRDEVR